MEQQRINAAELSRRSGLSEASINTTLRSDNPNPTKSTIEALASPRRHYPLTQANPLFARFPFVLKGELSPKELAFDDSQGYLQHLLHSNIIAKLYWLGKYLSYAAQFL